MPLRSDLQELRSRNREELDRLSGSLAMVSALVGTFLVVLVPVLYGALVVGDIDWIDSKFWWVFLAVIVAIGWSVGVVPDLIRSRFRRHVLLLRTELEQGLWFFIAEDSAWELLRERQARLPLLAPLNARRPDNIPDQLRVCATYHRSLIALNHQRDPASGGTSEFSSCTLLADRLDGICCAENFSLSCMACGGLIPVALLWPLALWPLARYIEYKAAVDEFCRFLLADGATEPAASQDDSKSSGDDNTP